MDSRPRGTAEAPPFRNIGASTANLPELAATPCDAPLPATGTPPAPVTASPPSATQMEPAAVQTAPQLSSSATDDAELKQELIECCLERVHDYDVLTAQFQKFPFMKLILRLLTEICANEPRVRRPTKPIPATQDETTRNGQASTSNNDGAHEVVLQNDGLGYVHQHLSAVLRPLTKEGVFSQDAILRVKPPILSRDLDRLVVGLGAVAKLYVADIIAESLAVMQSDTEGQPGARQIEPRHVYEALRTLNTTSD